MIMSKIPFCPAMACSVTDHRCLLVTVHWSLFTVHWSLVTVHWSLVTGHWSLVTGHWSLVTVHWSLVTGHWSLVTGHWSLVTGHWSLVTGHWSLVTGHWSLVTGHWSLVTGHAACRRPWSPRYIISMQLCKNRMNAFRLAMDSLIPPTAAHTKPRSSLLDSLARAGAHPNEVGGLVGRDSVWPEAPGTGRPEVRPTGENPHSDAPYERCPLLATGSRVSGRTPALTL